jgi:acetoin utilization protein AcuB
MHRHSIPLIQKYMTTTPFSVNWDDNLQTAMQTMSKNSIRHLPVLKSGVLVGILSDRDIQLAMSIRGVDAALTLAGDIAVDDIYISSPDTPLFQVVHHMAEKKLGSTLIVQNHKLVGIFTSSDAMRILGDILESR